MANGSVTYTYQAPSPMYPGSTGFVIRSTDGAFIPCVPSNLDYQTFLQWIADGNPAPEGWTGPTNE